MKQNVLVVDDNPHIINRIIDILSDNYSNYNFFPAKNGEVGYRLAVSRKPDLIITDWDMPIVDGIELIRNLKRNNQTRNIPVIMATAVMLSPEDLKLALETGAMDYIRKPIDPVELVARVQSVIRVTDYYKLLLESQKKELTENTLLLIKSNEFNASITKSLKQLYEKISDKNQEMSSLYNKIVDKINSKISDDTWQRFEIAFNSANNNFKKSILSQFPSLTQKDLKLCIFLKLDLSTKDIASILNVESDSIKVARYRLRKKMNLTKEQNLQSFISTF